MADEYRTMADRFREEYYKIPSAPSAPNATYETMTDRFRREFHDLPPRPADPRHTTMAEQFRMEMWRTRNAHD